MKRCTQTHINPSFGEIPEGSLWDDDSPYLGDGSNFADVETTAKVQKTSKAVRKFGQKPAAVVADVHPGSFTETRDLDDQFNEEI